MSDIDFISTIIIVIVSCIGVVVLLYYAKRSFSLLTRTNRKRELPLRIFLPPAEEEEEDEENQHFDLHESPYGKKKKKKKRHYKTRKELEEEAAAAQEAALHADSDNQSSAHQGLYAQVFCCCNLAAPIANIATTGGAPSDDARESKDADDEFPDWEAQFEQEDKAYNANRTSKEEELTSPSDKPRGRPQEEKPVELDMDALRGLTDVRYAQAGLSEDVKVDYGELRSAAVESQKRAEEEAGRAEEDVWSRAAKEKNDKDTVAEESENGDAEGAETATQASEARSERSSRSSNSHTTASTKEESKKKKQTLTNKQRRDLEKLLLAAEASNLVNNTQRHDTGEDAGINQGGVAGRGVPVNIERDLTERYRNFQYPEFDANTDPIASFDYRDTESRRRAYEITVRRQKKRVDEKIASLKEGKVDEMLENSGPLPRFIPPNFKLAEEMPTRDTDLTFKHVLYRWDKEGIQGWFLAKVHLAIVDKPPLNWTLKYDISQTHHRNLNGVVQSQLDMAGPFGYGKRWVLLEEDDRTIEEREAYLNNTRIDTGQMQLGPRGPMSRGLSRGLDVEMGNAGPLDSRMHLSHFDSATA